MCTVYTGTHERIPKYAVIYQAAYDSQRLYVVCLASLILQVYTGCTQVYAGCTEAYTGCTRGSHWYMQGAHRYTQGAYGYMQGAH